MHEYFNFNDYEHRQVGYPDRTGFSKAWGESPMNPVRHCYFASKAAELIWDRTKYVSATTFPVFDTTMESMGDIRSDLAADQAHPGPNSNMIIAQKLSNLLG